MDVDHNIFPNLRCTYLKVFADRVAIEHDYIVKITLHHAPFHSYVNVLSFWPTRLYFDRRPDDLFVSIRIDPP